MSIWSSMSSFGSLSGRVVTVYDLGDDEHRGPIELDVAIGYGDVARLAFWGEGSAAQMDIELMADLDAVERLIEQLMAVRESMLRYANGRSDGKPDSVPPRSSPDVQ